MEELKVRKQYKPSTYLCEEVWYYPDTKKYFKFIKEDGKVLKQFQVYPVYTIDYSCAANNFMDEKYSMYFTKTQLEILNHLQKMEIPISAYDLSRLIGNTPQVIKVMVCNIRKICRKHTLDFSIKTKKGYSLIFT